MKRKTYKQAITRLRSMRHTVTPETAPACLRYAKLMIDNCSEIEQIEETRGVLIQIARNARWELNS